MYSQDLKIQNETVGMTGEDAIEYIRDLEEEEDLKVHADIAIPDGILRAVNAQYNLTNMGNESSNTYDIKSGGTYVYMERNYQIKMYNYYHRIHHGPDGKTKQLTIKLSHNGFIYTKRRFTLQGQITHNRTEWYVLGDYIFSDMPYLKSLANNLNAKIMFYYNIKHKRIDVQFFRNPDDTDDDSFIDEDQKPLMLITFETGNSVTKTPKKYLI